MARIHRVRQGETLSGIAQQYGLGPWDSLWDKNPDLRAKRKSPHVLQPGDEVEIPDLEPRQEQAPTEQKHSFRLKNAPLVLNLVLRDLDGDALSNLGYVLKVGDETHEGTTDVEGKISHPVPVDQTEAKLVLKLGEDETGTAGELVVPLSVGSLNPVDDMAGVQARLNNLGYDSGSADGILGPITAAALRAFQDHEKLKVTGKPDQPTRDRLEQAHGC